jgi:integrase
MRAWRHLPKRGVGGTGRSSPALPIASRPFQERSTVNEQQHLIDVGAHRALQLTPTDFASAALETEDAIGEWRDHLLHTDRTEQWAARSVRWIERIFTDAVAERRGAAPVEHHLLVDDPVYGGSRRVVLIDLMRAGEGRVFFRSLRRALERLVAAGVLKKGVVGDLLRTLRVFLRWVEGNPILDSGRDLRRWGCGLVCPILDREVPKRASDYQPVVPSVSLLSRLYQHLLEVWWPSKDGNPVHARTMVMLILMFETGLRGAELRDLRIDEQISLAEGLLLILRETKNDHAREIALGPFARQVLGWYLGSVRPALTDDIHGHLFVPRVRRERAMSGSLYAASMRELLDHLADTALLMKGMRPHTLRAAHATQMADFLRGVHDASPLPEAAERSLMRHHGWLDPGMFRRHYDKPQADDFQEGA